MEETKKKTTEQQSSIRKGSPMEGVKIYNGHVCVGLYVLFDRRYWY